MLRHFRDLYHRSLRFFAGHLLSPCARCFPPSSLSHTFHLPLHHVHQLRHQPFCSTTLHLAILIKVDIIKQFILQLSSVKNPAWGTSPVWNCLEIFRSGVALFNFLRSEIGKNHYDDFGLSCRGLGAKRA